MQDTISFSDGNPIYEYGVFVTILSLAFAILHVAPAKALLDRLSYHLRLFVIRRNALPLGSASFEVIKLDIARMVVGALATIRYGDVLLSSMHTGNQRAIFIAGIATALSMMVACGLFTRLSAVVLMSTSNILIDNYLGASTLGTMVMSMLLLIFAIAPAGQSLSLDAFLWPRKKAANVDQILVAKLAGLLAYYCVCLYSVLWHTQDEAWLSGYVIGWVLLSPASNPKYAEFAWMVHQFSPWLYVNFARLSIAGMFVWYSMVLPGLFLSKITRIFVVAWGVSFFLISAFILPLSYLGFYELCLWAILFIPPMRSKKADIALPVPGIDKVSGALTISLLVLAAAFALRMPLMTLDPDLRNPGAWIKQTIASAPAAVGIHKINVFNTQDLAVFTFEWKNYVATQGVDFSDPAELLSTLNPLPAENFSMDDVARYGIARNSRRVSRTDIGCDREYWQAILPYLKQSVHSSGETKTIDEIVSVRFISTWPTADDFGSYAHLPRQTLPLCSAHLDLNAGSIKDFKIHQSGLDESLRRRGRDPFLSAKNFEAIRGYPCASDGRFMWALETGKSDLENDEDLRTGIMSVTVSKFGRFQLDCLLEVHDIEKRWGARLLSNIQPTKEACEYGITLMSGLSQAAVLVPSIDLSSARTAADRSARMHDWDGCIKSVIEGRKVYWGAIAGHSEDEPAIKHLTKQTS
ncbi:hypothetical protein EVB88_034 [Rhizobium phage RHph_N28_2]|nr:hypothetical protein EVB88_034 [Rhizobium phage RHph_N28_2]